MDEHRRAEAAPSRTGIAGSARAFAGTVQSGITPNCSQRIGAVTTPHAAEIPITSRSPTAPDIPRAPDGGAAA